MLFTYQKRISFGLCLLFLYYYAFPFFESYEFDKHQTGINHATNTFHIHYLPLYVTAIWEHSKFSFDHLLYTKSQFNYLNDSYLSLTISLLISILLICELLFFCRWRCLENYINKNVTMFDTKPNITNQRRDHILKMAAKYASLYDKGMTGWTQLWFKGTDFKDINYDNVIEFLQWAFFLNFYENNNKTAKEKKWRQDFISFAMQSIENITSRKIPKGYNPNISFVHNTNDNRPLSVTYRPFIFYFSLLIGQFIADLMFEYLLKFKYQYVNGLKVWYKIQSDKQQNVQSKPILLVHGLGAVHYFPYFTMIYKMYNKSVCNDIFCVEIPWTTMSLWHFIPKSIWNLFSNNSSPSYIDSKLPATKLDFIQILQKMEDLIIFAKSDKNIMFERTDNNLLSLKWTLIGHSYGSFIVSGIYHFIKHNGSRMEHEEEINLPRLILLDPVTMCLSQPTTVSFLVLKSMDWTTFILQHLAAKELMIACTLSKYFHWFEYVIFPEDLINKQVEHCIVTASNDTLIPEYLIKKGIDGVNIKTEKEKLEYKKIKHISFENMHHAIWLGFPSLVQKIVDMV